MEKEEYIRKLKQLIKKYHPDLCKDVYLEGMYNEITIKLNQKLNQVRTENNIKENIIYKNHGKINLSRNKNTQSYEYYKLGIKFYKNIHPNQFYKRNADGTFEPKTYDEQLKLFLPIKLTQGIDTGIIYQGGIRQWLNKKVWISWNSNNDFQQITLAVITYSKYAGPTV